MDDGEGGDGLRELLKSKDEELKLAARLGQALVRKETKQAELLDRAKQRIRALEQELQQCATSELVGERDRLRAENQRLEDHNFKLQYDLKRLELQLDEKPEGKDGGAEDNTKEKEIARLEARLARQARQHEVALAALAEEHDGELEALKKVNERQLQEYVRASEHETKALMRSMEEQLDALRNEIDAKLRRSQSIRTCVSECELALLATKDSFHTEVEALGPPPLATNESSRTIAEADLAPEDKGAGDPIAAPEKLGHASFKSTSGDACKSFASRFSTDTLDLDLDLDLDFDEDIALDVEASIAEHGEEAAAPAPAPAPDDKALSTIPSSLANRKSADGPEHMLMQLKRVSLESASTSSITGESASSTMMGTRNTSRHKKKPSGLPSRLLPATVSPAPRPTSGAQKGKVAQAYGKASWQDAHKGPVGVQTSASSPKAKAKWATRFCVVADGMFFVFRSETDARKYSFHLVELERAEAEEDPLGDDEQNAQRTDAIRAKAKTFRPLQELAVSRCVVQVVRRPSAADTDADARSSMLAWLKKRNKSDAGSFASGKSHRQMAFRVQLVQQADGGAGAIVLPARVGFPSTGSAASGGTGASRSGASLGSDDDAMSLSSGSCARPVSSASSCGGKSAPGLAFVQLAHPSETQRMHLVDALMAEGAVRRVDAGAVWIRQKRPKKDDEWVKRYAVVSPSRLELFAADNTCVLREQVALVSIKVEPAYSAHIFLSHKLHHKQLVTLRAFDGTERNWWVGALRAATTSAAAGDRRRQG